MTPTREATLALLEGFRPCDGKAASSVAATTAVLQHSMDPFVRTQYDPGHITASGLVLSRDADRILLVYHPRLQAWLQPGGHVEPWDRTVQDTARREVLEETGATLLAEPPRLVAVDTHPIPATPGEPVHRHFDLMFRFRVDSCIIKGSPSEVRWVRVEELPAWCPDATILRAVRTARS